MAADPGNDTSRPALATPRLTRRWRYILYATMGYTIFAVAWVIYSEQLLADIVDSETLLRLSAWEDLAFVGISAILLVVALAKMPAPNAVPRRNFKPRPWALLAVFAAMAAAILTIGILAYSTEVRSIEAAELDRLAGTVKLKGMGVERWLSERRANVATLTESQVLRDDLSRWLHDADPEARRRIEVRMRGFVSHYRFSAIRLYDADERLQLSVGGDSWPDMEGMRLVRRALEGNVALTSDLHAGANGTLRIGFVAPIVSHDGTADAPIGVMAFDLRPDDFLFPFLQNWPTASHSRESFLARSQGDDLIAISPLRTSDIPTPHLVMTRNGSTRLQSSIARSTGEGADGTEVLAARYPMSGTPWVLVAKIDQEEVLAGVKRAAFATAVVVLLALLAAAGLMVFLWQRRQLQNALTEISLNDYLAGVADALPGTLLSFRMRADGELSLPYSSRNLRDVIGVDPAAVAEDAAALFDRIHPEDRDRLRNRIVRSGLTQSLLCEEVRIQSEARGEIWIECRAMPARDLDGGLVWHGIGLDVTGRKQAEERQRLAASVFTHSHDGIIVTDRSRGIIAVNPAFCTITGYDETEAIGQNPRLLRSGRHDAAFYQAMWGAIGRTGYWQGEIWNRRKSGEIYPEWMTISEVRDDAGEIVNYVATFSDISRIKQSEAQLEHLASHDTLTGLANRQALRTALDELVSQRKDDGGMAAVLLLDLDRFRFINDSYGHAAGDRLLKLVAQRLMGKVRMTDTVARTSGDGFTVLLSPVASRTEAGEFACRLRNALSEPFVLESGQSLYVGASFGISLFPEDTTNADELLQHAGAALHHTKVAGGSSCCFYSSIFTDNAMARAALETDLRGAMERGEFVLHYQPLVALDARRITGVEALIRWRGPGGALVPPGLFIPVAEETGMIVPLGEWVLRTACAQMVAWLREGIELDCVAVNLSPAQFSDPNLIDRIGEILAATALPARRLELEITEGALVGDGDVVDRIARLKALGVRLAIDDFGTGYSSLSYLKRLPVDKLKIDRSFVSGLPDDAADAKITHAVVEMGRSLGLEVLAEGVETEAQLAFLRDQGCDTAQGFLFGAAMTPDEIAGLAHEYSSLAAPALKLVAGA